MNKFEFTGIAPKPDKGSFGLAESEKSREDIYESSKKLADYISQAEIKNVFFLDNSARQAYIGLQEIWKKEHNQEEKPSIYFINPDSLKYADDTDEALVEEFNKTYYNINKNEKILIYDACIHSGSTVFSVQDFLKKLGFTDVRVAITSVSSDFPSSDLEKLDLVCLEGRPAAGCHPYGKPGYVQKTGMLVGKANLNEQKRNQAIVDHQKIKNVFKEQEK